MSGPATIAQAGATRRYRTLLTSPGVPRFVASGTVGRLPLGMTPLAVLLVLRANGHSYAAGGVVLGAYSLALGVAGPFLARLIDRSSQARVLLPLAVAFPVAVGSLVVLPGRAPRSP